jgi:hypothetical protein
MPMALPAVATTEAETTLSTEEGRELFVREARRLLGISGDEFVRRWEAGDYRDLPDMPEAWKAMRVAFQIPFGQPES